MKSASFLFLLCLSFPAQAAPRVKVWLTTADGKEHLSRQSDLSFGEDGRSGAHTIVIDEHTRYQAMDGFGASLTDSSTSVETPIDFPWNTQSGSGCRARTLSAR